MTVMTGTYTLSDVTRMTGAKRRAIQLWADGGVINAISSTDRAGAGVHRLFTGGEVTLAALLVPMANIGVPIGYLKVFTASIRQAERRELAVTMWRATKGIGENFLCFAHAPTSLWFGTKTDEDGPICIDPSRDLPEFLKQLRPAPAMIVLNLTDLLFGLLDR